LAASARAQTTTGSGPVIAATQLLPPERFVNGVDVGESERSQALTPLGINYDDCVRNMTLQFTLLLSGFTGQDNVQVWATNQGDCSTAAERGIGPPPTCWLVNEGLVEPNLELSTTKTFAVRVQDLVGPQAPLGTIPPGGTIPNAGVDACTHQSSFAAVPITIQFLALQPNGDPDTTATNYSYTLPTDLVGPPTPAGVSIGVGDTLFDVTWTANSDADTAGYDVFIDPAPGQVASDATATADTNTQLVCSVSGDASTDAGCILLSTGGSAGTGAAVCGSSVLTSALVQQTNIAEVTETDDAGNVIVEAGTTLEGNAGIATIPCRNLVGASCAAGSPVYAAQSSSVTGESDARFTVSGLTDGDKYTVAVSAVDFFGNPGPPSVEQCATPMPVNDFYKLYREGGGTAGGGFCTIAAVGSRRGSSAFGIGVIATIVALGLGRQRSRSRIDSR
jgi:hypothetical protein